jgi:hypothetical protein
MKKIIKSFFCDSEDNFKPPYFWITMLMILLITMITGKIFNFLKISDTLMISTCGFVVAWLGVYNFYKKVK